MRKDKTKMDLGYFIIVSGKDRNVVDCYLKREGNDQDMIKGALEMIYPECRVIESDKPMKAGDAWPKAPDAEVGK